MLAVHKVFGAPEADKEYFRFGGCFQNLWFGSLDYPVLVSKRSSKIGSFIPYMVIRGFVLKTIDRIKRPGVIDGHQFHSRKCIAIHRLRSFTSYYKKSEAFLKGKFSTPQQGKIRGLSNISETIALERNPEDILFQFRFLVSS